MTGKKGINMSKKQGTPVITGQHIISTLVQVRTLVDAMIEALMASERVEYAQLPPPVALDRKIYDKNCPPPPVFDRHCPPPVWSKLCKPDQAPHDAPLPAPVQVASDSCPEVVVLTRPKEGVKTRSKRSRR
jgi:hypothetical protein